MSYFDEKYQEIKSAIESWNDKTAKDIYAISFWVDFIDDEPERVQMILGFNTNSNFQKQTTKASNPAEAKWNFAFWIQNQELEIGGDDAVFQQWMSGKTDKDFINELKKIAQRLFEEKIILKKFGREIPIIIHELEYYDEIAEQNREINPKGIADDFVNWIDNL